MNDRRLALPATFYQQGRVVRALTFHDFGEFFRAVRAALDLTQEEFGLLVGLAQSHVCKIEKGRLPLRDIETLARLIQIFAIPADLLGFPYCSASVIHGTSEDELPKAAAVRGDIPSASTALLPIAKTSRSARECISALVAESLPSHQYDDHNRKATLLKSIRLLTELDDDEPPAKSMIGPVDVERIRQHVALFELVVWRIGGAELRLLVTQYIVRVSRIVRSRASEPAVHVQLNRILAELHRMAGWMHLHAEDHGAARQHWDAGVRAADRGRDGVLVARILDGRSQQLCHFGRYDQASTMVRQARTIVDGLATPAVMTMLIGRTEAWICAEKGQREDALTAIGRAQEAYGNARPAEDPPWAQWFDEAQLLSAEGHCLKILAYRSTGDAHRAAELIARSIEMMPLRAEHSRMLNLPGLASALVLAGELDEAARVFRSALTAVAAAGSSEARMRLRRDFRRYATPQAGRHRELRNVGIELGALYAREDDAAPCE